MTVNTATHIAALVGKATNKEQKNDTEETETGGQKKKNKKQKESKREHARRLLCCGSPTFAIKREKLFVTFCGICLPRTKGTVFLRCAGHARNHQPSPQRRRPSRVAYCYTAHQVGRYMPAAPLSSGWASSVRPPYILVAAPPRLVSTSLCVTPDTQEDPFTPSWVLVHFLSLSRRDQLSRDA